VDRTFSYVGLAANHQVSAKSFSFCSKFLRRNLREYEGMVLDHHACSIPSCLTHLFCIRSSVLHFVSVATRPEILHTARIAQNGVAVQTACVTRGHASVSLLKSCPEPKTRFGIEVWRPKFFFFALCNFWTLPYSFQSYISIFPYELDTLCLSCALAQQCNIFHVREVG